MTERDPKKGKSAAIDWQALRHRLEESRAALARGFVPAEEEKARILETRARALAREQQDGRTSGREMEVIAFFLAREKYAVESAFVREVYPLKTLTYLPCTPPFVLGIVNVRGQILSVVDLHEFFDLPRKGLSDLNKVIILHKDGMEFGILADVILGVERIPLEDVQAGLPTLTGIRENYLRGIGRGRVVVLDADKLLSDDTMIVHEDVEL